MNFPKLTALLGVAQIEMHSNFFGNKKPVAKLDQEQLEAIEKGLEQNDVSALTSEIEAKGNDITALIANQTAMEEAITGALQLNGLELPENATQAEAIALLATTCKEYGEAKNVTHSVAGSNGVEAVQNPDALIDGYLDPNDEHNKQYFNTTK